MALRRQQFFDVKELLLELSTPRHVGRVAWESETEGPARVTAEHLQAVKECLGELAHAIRVEAWA